MDGYTKSDIRTIHRDGAGRTIGYTMKDGTFYHVQGDRLIKGAQQQPPNLPENKPLTNDGK